MRTTRVLAVTFALVVFSAAPSAFAKVCHPKKPVTCNAAALSTLGTASALTTTGAKVKATAVKTKSDIKVQQAMLCGPWVHYRCSVGTIG